MDLRLEFVEDTVFPRKAQDCCATVYLMMVNGTILSQAQVLNHFLWLKSLTVITIVVNLKHSKSI